MKTVIKRIRTLDGKVNHVRDEFIKQSKDRKFGLQEKTDEKASITKFLKLEKEVDKMAASKRENTRVEQGSQQGVEPEKTPTEKPDESLKIFDESGPRYKSEASDLINLDEAPVPDFIKDFADVDYDAYIEQ